MAMKQFDPRNVPKIEFLFPNLTIGGVKLKFIVDVAADASSVQCDHFKELRRFISVDPQRRQDENRNSPSPLLRYGSC